MTRHPAIGKLALALALGVIVAGCGPSLLLLVFGFSETPNYILIALSAFFVMLINTAAGIRGIDPALVDVADAFGLRGLKRLRTLILPGALPIVLAGVRLAVAQCFLAAIAIEFLNSRDGLGAMIFRSFQLFDVRLTFVGLVAAGLVGSLLFRFTDVLEYLAMPWRRVRRGL